MVQYVKGRELDQIAIKLGLKRNRYFLFFKESDKKLRCRCEHRVQQICQRKLSVLGCKLEV